jgi:membrane protein involved in colicin uptake
MTDQKPVTDQQLDDIDRSVAVTFDQLEPDETRRARWEAAALTASREVDRNALRVYMAVADAEQRALADSWAKSVAAADAKIRSLQARVAEMEPDVDLLEALRAYGVDNWDGYDEAIQAAESASS